MGKIAGGKFGEKIVSWLSYDIFLLWFVKPDGYIVFLKYHLLSHDAKLSLYGKNHQLAR